MRQRYSEEELLFLSDIQHFCFCPRQWQLITVEQLWQDNPLTIMGKLMHNRVDNPEESCRVGNLLTLRRVPLVSFTLGLYGLSDAVECIPASDGSSSFFTHPKYPEKWQIYPVEYKKGKPKKNHSDLLQLTAQVVALEEMYSLCIPVAYLFYGETRKRLEVPITSSLRDETEQVARQMHQAFRYRKVYPPTYTARCRSCSLIDECLPKIASHRSAKSYLKRSKLFDPS